MPKVRAQDKLKTIIRPLADRFAAEVSAAVMEFVQAQVREQVESVIGRVVKGLPNGTVPRVRAAVRPCRVPGCGRPSKGPRFDFFCEVHRSLPAEEKEKIKAAASTPESGEDGAASSTAPSGRGRPRKAAKREGASRGKARA